MTQSGLQLCPSTKSIVSIKVLSKWAKPFITRGIKTFDDLTKHSEADLIKIPGIGAQVILHIRTTLKKEGLSLPGKRLVLKVKQKDKRSPQGWLRIYNIWVKRGRPPQKYFAAQIGVTYPAMIAGFKRLRKAGNIVEKDGQEVATPSIFPPPAPKKWPFEFLRALVLLQYHNLTIKGACEEAGIEWKEFVYLAHAYDPALYRRFGTRDRAGLSQGTKAADYSRMEKLRGTKAHREAQFNIERRTARIFRAEKIDFKYGGPAFLPVPGGWRKSPHRGT